MKYNEAMEGLNFYEKQIRPWGNFERFTLNEKTTVKIVTVEKDGVLSLQTHSHRSEFWKIISGHGGVVIGDEYKKASPGDMFLVPEHATHRIEATEGTLVFLEIAFGEFDENDIKRLEDKYGRA